MRFEAWDHIDEEGPAGSAEGGAAARAGGRRS